MRAEARRIAERWVAAVGLERFAGKYPKQLSGGMQQRVAIARVLANDPAVLLMDEPFGALDALTRTTMQAESARIHRETGTTVVFVTHSIEQAVFLADRVVVMSGGAAHAVPGHVERIVPVDLSARDVAAPEFNVLKREIAAVVRGGHEAAVDQPVGGEGRRGTAAAWHRVAVTLPEDWTAWRGAFDPERYDDRWRAMAERGENPHGEADFVCSYGPASVLDGGCGTGRVAIELARRGVAVLGVDSDPDMIAVARERAPELTWVHASLAELDRPERFDVVVLAGNVVPYVAAADRAAAVSRCARHLAPGGRLVAGFALRPGWPSLDDYDGWCADAGLQLTERYATWDRAPYSGGRYAVSVHRPVGGTAGGLSSQQGARETPWETP
ncbi:methyltransferase domain-containing protein [Pseudonocardia thermophila]|uniref:methyltransferase domain-containing protein n=1 Tax=Pseudonocardia thermophila TaxID=1848 RepID=UPI00248DECFF|nr:methyltransferase domain-containing protein [Pseudonocardia thermophila]